MRSATAIVLRLVSARGIDGMIEASATARPADRSRGRRRGRTPLGARGAASLDRDLRHVERSLALERGRLALQPFGRLEAEPHPT
jgi:hypothetical protein